ncbi:MAG: hypothetical protein MRZ75_05280 [Roseburia sp.]|nr:hypothetical protein [Roseburia sp.]
MKIGDTVYFLESGRIIRSAVIKRINGNLAIIQIDNGAIQLQLKRLFRTEEEIGNALRDKMIMDAKYGLYSTRKPSKAYETYMYDSEY